MIRYTIEHLLRLRHCTKSFSRVTRGVYNGLKSLGICSTKPTHRGTTAGKRSIRAIPVRLTKRHVSQFKTPDNALFQTDRKRTRLLSAVSNARCARTVEKLKVVHLNPRSVKNKTLAISDYITSNDYDIYSRKKETHHVKCSFFFRK